MTRVRQSAGYLLLLAALAAFSAFSLDAQEPAGISGTPPHDAPVLLSSVPVASVKSPVEQFRELLAMTLPQRRQALSNRPPEMARQIMAKVREYESLKPDERELRLSATELRWYLLPLMTEPRTNREALLARIPVEQRKIAESRLEQWDLFPPSAQEDLLNSETTARYFSHLETATEEQRKKLLSQMSPERRAKLEAGLDTWKILPEPQRQKILMSFNNFFELKPEEKARALGMLTEEEKQQMEKTLNEYEKLTPQQRSECIRSFQKFASMTLAERQAFLKNAERWKLMSPEERDEWRNLVELAPLYPPLPVDFYPPIPPSMPPDPRLSNPANKR
jgi:hypothetical protein